jgi:hypothetical protein
MRLYCAAQSILFQSNLCMVKGCRVLVLLEVLLRRYLLHGPFFRESS